MIDKRINGPENRTSLLQYHDIYNNHIGIESSGMIVIQL